MRLLTGSPPELFELARAYVGETDALHQRLAVSDLVISEAYFACQHHYRMTKGDVLAGLHELLSKPVFAVDPTVLQLLGQSGMARAKPGFIDQLIHLEYRRKGLGMVTFEKSASKLPDSQILG
jgi:predicted nucleic-acid-binding protein